MQNGNAPTSWRRSPGAKRTPSLKRSAIRYLGNIRSATATETLTSLYASEQSKPRSRRAIIEALSNGERAAALVTLARGEKNLALKQEIVRRLGNMRDPEARAYLLELLK